MFCMMKGSMLEHVDVLKIITFINLAHLLDDFVDKAACYMENNTRKNIMFLKWNIRSSGNITFR